MTGRPAAASQLVTWEHLGVTHRAMWWSTNDRPVPRRVIVVDDRLTAAQAVKHASQGTAMLWLGDFQNARQMLGAMGRRITKSGRARADRSELNSASELSEASQLSDAEEFYRIRQARAQRSRMLSLILVPLTFDETSGTATLPLPRAPEVGAAVHFGYRDQPGFGDGSAVVSLQELTGVQGAHQWFVTGVDVPALGAKIHPHYGTFMPTRHEYVDLVARAPLPDRSLAFDIGTGTGVLAALLVRRGVAKVVGTDIHQRAVDCANDTFARLGIRESAEARLADMFPAGRAPLIVCNPPWLPGSAATSLDAAIYDPGSTMLLQFLEGLPQHLTDDGEGWLIISDLAELLGLRSRQMLLDAIDRAGLRVIDRLDTTPTHGRVSDRSDALHAARAREVTSLWRLGATRW